MEQKLFQFQYAPIVGLPDNMSELALAKDKWNWENYTKLYSMDIRKIVENSPKRIRKEKSAVEEEEGSKKSEIGEDLGVNTIEEGYDAI